MDERPAVGSDKIILGTMRLLEADRTAEECADYLLALHQLGIRKLHSSNEYESFPLLVEALQLLRRRRPDRRFRHMVKLAEPSFDDDDCFHADRLSSRINDYCSALGTDMIEDVQWMWRRKLDDDDGRIADFRRHADAIGEAVETEKERGSIERFLCFPYSVPFASAALELNWTDGLAVYRNAEEHDYDSTLEQAAAAAKIAVIIRPFFGGRLVGNGDPAQLLAAALDSPAIEAAVLSTNSISHMKALVS